MRDSVLVLLLIGCALSGGIKTQAQSGGVVTTINISTRAVVNTGENVIVGGFFVRGSAPKTVIIRALGPSLGGSGPPLVGVLQDPVLELYDSTGLLVQSNDNWQSDQELAIRNTGIPPTDPRESAIVKTLQPGSYSVVAHGKPPDVGLALVELYDLSVASESEVINISSRGNVEPGFAVMVGGFTVGGSSNVLVRAIGPELNANGITSALQDTILELYDSNATPIAINDDWETDQEAQILFTNAAPTDRRESAIVKILAPGSYTAVVRGKNNAIGIAQLEVFLLQQTGVP